MSQSGGGGGERFPASALLIEPFDRAKHDRSDFRSGVEALDAYLRRQAGQDARKRVSSLYVARDAGSPAIQGFYTLSAGSIERTSLPDATANPLPLYDRLPATLLGRLAVDERKRGTGVGKLLLFDAFSRALTASKLVASAILVVDAKDEAAAKFYRAFHFVPMPGVSGTFFLPMADIAALFP